ncbi:MAG: NPCBM/NEW2 domain-containing protein [Planctomycetaceae bacterium]|nr:NPCBM/NEW2 domain-containing protein [Planctomycetaceae bacterium]
MDFLSGLVSAVTESEVSFLLDGDQIPVPRQRVTGIVFAEADGSAGAPAGMASLSMNDGSRLKVSQVTLESGQVTATASWGQKLAFDAKLLSGIDFSSGRLHYLSDLEPLTEQYFGLDPSGKGWTDLFDEDSATRTGLSRLWKMSRDSFPNNGRPPLTLDHRQYRKGLCIFPKARIEYALDGRYLTFTALVGIDDEVAFNQRKGLPPTQAELIIEGDGRQLVRRSVTATESPFPLELDVKNITTLVVAVDFGDGDSVCDYVDLADARLIVNPSPEKQ